MGKLETREVQSRLPAFFLTPQPLYRLLLIVQPIAQQFLEFGVFRVGLKCLCGLFLVASFLCSGAQPKSDLNPPPLDPQEGERQGRALISHLLEQRPEQAATNSAVLKIRDGQGKQRDVAARFEVVPMADHWMNIYEAANGPHSRPTLLKIIHNGQQPNEYFLSDGSGSQTTALKKLMPGDLMIPFAGSDFWVIDLGLDFLHWPQQRVLRNQMRKGLSCYVLQSVNPQPTKGGYSRVVSWIAINRPEDIVIVHAEAFDDHDKLLKEFDPKKVEKVNGLWQLEEMEIRNRQAGTRTRIEFNLDRQ